MKCPKCDAVISSAGWLGFVALGVVQIVFGRSFVAEIMSLGFIAAALVALRMTQLEVVPLDHGRAAAT